jgi:hypothetical protein
MQIIFVWDVTYELTEMAKPRPARGLCLQKNASERDQGFKKAKLSAVVV